MKIKIFTAWLVGFLSFSCGLTLSAQTQTEPSQATGAKAATPKASEALSLAGKWRFEMDSKDVGKAEGFFKRELTGGIQLPGSMSENGIGNPITVIRQNTWGGSWTTNPVWHPMIKIDYRGAAWYQTSVTIPEEWQGKIIDLFLERVCWQSELWVDDVAVGSRDSLTTPHQYEIGILKPGTHRLTLRVDNRKLFELGCNTHSYHEQSCTIYNGIVGQIELRARPAVFVRSCQVYPDATTGKCELRMTIANRTAAEVSRKISVDIYSWPETPSVLAENNMEVSLPPGETEVKLTVEVPKDEMKLWSEFKRPLYLARLRMGGEVLDTRFGFRRYETKGAQFFINGKVVLMRGEANNAQFPLTGHPPMDKEGWLKIFALFKSFGLNHFRFHAWVPPEAAFAAADELGIYLQPELPNGEDSVIRDTARGLPWRRAEFDRILDTYGNHPSFMQITMGNEAKTKEIDFLKGLVKRGREHDNRHLYATISNPEASGVKVEVPGDDFAVAHGSAKAPFRRRMNGFFSRNAPETMVDYRPTMEGRPVPQIAHEVGQWYVYPDLSEIAKYTGVLKPVNLEYFYQQAAKGNVLKQVPDFVNASGRLSLLLYKEEVERALRTPANGGFDLLGVQDSFDQGSAYVGMVNNFFEPKPFVTAAQFHEFCGSQTPLARMKQRVWMNDETFEAAIELANYGPGPLTQAVVAWQVMEGERVVGQGEFGAQDIPDTGLHSVGQIQLPLMNFIQATKLELRVSVRGTAIRNRWDLWVYPQKIANEVPENVKVVQTLDEKTMQELRDGARVVLLPSNYISDYPTAMTPPFWSPIMFRSNKQTIGLLCDPKHPALQGFPTDSHSNWQWFDLLFQGSAIWLEDVPADYRPIVQAIDHPDRNHKLALIYETKVGKGRLLVCTLDLNRELDKRPVARQLRASLLAYAASPKFHPTLELDLEKNLPNTNPKPVLALLSPKITADSEHEGSLAFCAVDNNPTTLWESDKTAAGTPLPHALTFELKEPINIKGFVQTPRADGEGNGRIKKFRLHVSDDGKAWRIVAEGEWPDSKVPQRVWLAKPERTRFIRLEAVTAHGKSKNNVSVAEFDVIIP